MEFKEEIKYLMQKKHEGDYWDYKEVHHENKAALLHDIISLANSLTKENKYLIYGVTDKGIIKGLDKSQNLRRKQSDLIDFLRGKKFAADIRPEVELKSIKIDLKEIDVLIIFDRPEHKPYYLLEECKDKDKVVRPNNIYTRIIDTNTPIDKTADPIIVERLWKQRFGLDINPLEKMKFLLRKPDEWFKDIGNKNYAYHKQFPEYQIEFGEWEDDRDAYSYFFINERSFSGDVFFKYHSTTLFEAGYLYCDEMRIMLSYPSIQHLNIRGKDQWYYYFEKDTIEGLLLHYLTDEIDILSRNGYDPFIVFSNEAEREKFNKYILKNIKTLNSLSANLAAKNAKKRIEKSKIGIRIDPIFIDKIVQMKDKWDLKEI